MEEIWSILPLEIRHRLTSLPPEVIDNLEEIRLRTERPVEIVSNQQSSFVTEKGTLTQNPAHGWILDRMTADKLLNLISDHSFYAMDEQLKRGYVTVKGGHRIGIVGRVLVENGRIEGIKEVASFNIRVAREKKGIAHPILPYLIEGNHLLHTLIISPPQCGKTTLLRDIARLVSYGNAHMSGKKVGIVDERSEIAGCVQGMPQKDVGVRTDVLDGCPKAEGMMMMIRSMSPDVMVTDEIGKKEDARAVQEVLNAGVVLLASAHGRDVEEIARRPTLSDILNMGFFQRFVVLSRRQGPGTVEGIYDANLRPLLKERSIC